MNALGGVLDSLNTKRPQEVMVLQSEYAKTTYDAFVAEAKKTSELYADLAKQTYKPFGARASDVAASFLFATRRRRPYLGATVAIGRMPCRP
jgi:hypothetical protein